ncbi:MAG: radical SAM protein [Desulfosarcina sp.]|nr:radical SAM protein [Desulfobacterales bacterium]
MISLKDITINSTLPILSRMEVVEKIYEKQKELKDSLEIHNDGLSVWTKTPSAKTLSFGCQTCKAGKWLCLYVGKKCNIDCVYCAQGTKHEKMIDPERPDLINDTHHIEDVKKMLNDPEAIWAGQHVGGIGYSGGEPFIYLDKVLDLANFVSTHHKHIYQWIYTNGMLVTEDKLKMLYNVGIREIRFHIGATNFNKKVLDNLKMATGVMDYVNIETPAGPKLKEFLIDKEWIFRLEDMGVYQMNFGELSTVGVNEMQKFLLGHKRVIEYFQKNQLYVYESFLGKSVLGRNLSQFYISPIISRETTYEIMKYVIDNKIDILINDCSQDAKHVQRLQRNFSEQNAKIVTDNSSKGAGCVEKMVNDNSKLKQAMVGKHKKSETVNYDMKSIIQNTTHKVDNKYQLNLEELQEEIGKAANIKW